MVKNNLNISTITTFIIKNISGHDIRYKCKHSR
jgi:hypothetical protein